MTTTLTLRHPLDESLHACQPLAVVEEGALCVCVGTEPPDAVMVTAAGLEYPMACLAPQAELIGHARDVNRAGVKVAIREAIASASARRLTDALEYFYYDVVLPVRARDFADAADGQPQRPGPRPPAAPPADLAEALESAAGEFPLAPLPVPSLVFLGRAWALGPAVRVPGRMGLLYRGRWYTPTGRHVTVGTLKREWAERVRRYVTDCAQALAPPEPEPEPESEEGADASPAAAELRKARQQLRAEGHVRIDNLLFLPGNPPKLGVILPDHQNVSLWKRVEQDAAMVSDLALPPHPGANLSLYVRGADGRWSRSVLPHGLCAGFAGSERTPYPPNASAGLKAAVYLYTAAVHYGAQNRRFHVNDGPEDFEAHHAHHDRY